MQKLDYDEVTVLMVDGAAVVLPSYDYERNEVLPVVEDELACAA